MLQRLQRNWLRATFETRLALLSRLSRRTGIRSREREQQELVISLTTIGSRLCRVHVTVESLLRQQLQPHRVILWLGEDLRETLLPPALVRQQQRGLEVRFQRDVGPATKLVHALREHPEAMIVTADDDTLYPGTWLQQLHDSFRKIPNVIHCYRAHWILSEGGGSLAPYRNWKLLAPGVTGPAHRLFPTGVGGVLYPPNSLGAEVLNEKAMLELSPGNDDIWFKGMALLNRVPAAKVRPVFDGFPTVRNAKQAGGLSADSTFNDRNDRQLHAVFSRYELFGSMD